MTSFGPEALSWPQAAMAVTEAVDALVQVPAADLLDAQLAEALEHAAAQASRLHAVAVRVTAEAGTRGTWRAQGASSLRGWVRRCVQLADDAARLVTAARMLAVMPRMATLFSAGQVSLAQMGAAARQVRRLPDIPAWQDGRAASEGIPAGRLHGSAAEPSSDSADPAAGMDAAGCADAAGGGEAVAAGLPGSAGGDVEAARVGDLRAAADDILAGHAPAADARTLAAIGEHIFAAADPADHGGESLSRRERRHLSICRGFENMGEVSGRLDPEATERAMTVLNALSAQAGPDDHRTAGQRRADAFDTLCRKWLESGSVPPAKDGKAKRDRVIVTIPYATLIGLPGAPGAVLGSGFPIPAETARRLSCDASIRRVVLSPPIPYVGGGCDHTCSLPRRGDTTARDGAAARTGATTDSGLDNPDRSGKSGASPDRDMTQRHLSRREPELAHRDARQHPNQSGHRDARQRPGEPGHGEVSRRVGEPANDGVRRGDFSDPDLSWIDPGDTGGGAQRTRSRSPGFDPNEKLANILRAAISALPPPLGARSAVLDAGRSAPGFTQPMRDALHAQYGGRCTFRGCGQPATVIHHIIHWSQGGPTSVANGGPVCDYHHYLVHEGGWRLYKDSDGTVVAVPPPLTWPGVRTHWRNGRPVAGKPPGTRSPGTGTGSAAGGTGAGGTGQPK